MPAITASSSPRSSAPRPSSCGRAPRACAISAPACRRPTPSTCCKASRRWRCAWSGTWRTRRRCSPSCRSNAAVEWVLHPSLPTHPDHALAQQLLPKRRGLDHQLRHQGRPRRRAQIHRGAAARQPSRQCRRRQDAGHPSGQHHASADGRRRSSRPPASARNWCASRSGIEAASDIIDDLAQALRASQRA